MAVPPCFIDTCSTTITAAPTDAIQVDVETDDVSITCGPSGLYHRAFPLHFSYDANGLNHRVNASEFYYDATGLRLQCGATSYAARVGAGSGPIGNFQLGHPSTDGSGFFLVSASISQILVTNPWNCPATVFVGHEYGITFRSLAPALVLPDLEFVGHREDSATHAQYGMWHLTSIPTGNHNWRCSDMGIYTLGVGGSVNVLSGVSFRSNTFPVAVDNTQTATSVQVVRS